MSEMVSDPYERFSPFRRAATDIISGTAGGLMTVFVGHPLDTIKVRLQTAVGANKMGMAECIRLTLKEEGVRGFYKGMQSPLAGEGFFNAIQFFVYGTAKRFLLERDVLNNWDLRLQPVVVQAPGGPYVQTRHDLTVSEYFVAGAITGFFSSFVECPIDLFKSQLQTQIFQPKPQFTTFFQSISFILRTNGVRGIFQGLGSTFIRTTPASSFYFGTYEYAKELQLQPGQKKSELSSQALLVAGGLGGVSYWLSSFPLDSIKSSMQADAVVRSERRYKSVADCAKQLYKEGGIARFYRGLTPCLIRSFPANAACFYAYEKASAFLNSL